jgi:RecA-family ATPase
MTAGIAQLIESAKAFQPEPLANGWPDALDLAALATRDPQPPKQIMEGLPCGYCTIAAGHGGAGKSAIELHRAVCIAAAIPFCGLPVERRKVLFVSCEDRADVLHWRLTRICRHLGIELADLDGWLFILDLVGIDAILFSPDPRTGNVFTAAYGFLAERMREYGAEVLILDGVTDTFGGNENDRAQVKRFVNSLLALIQPERGALLLVAHVNKATASNGSTGEGYSGSTGWNNAPRARWYFFPEIVRDDEGGERAQRTGKLILELQKANHGETGTRIEFQWDGDAHLFIGNAIVTDFDRKHRDREEQTAILRALKTCAAAGITVPAATTGRRTAYHVITAQSVCLDSMRSGKPSVRRFWRQIEEMRAMGHIRDSSIRRTDRHYVATLELTDEGVRACGE